MNARSFSNGNGPDGNSGPGTGPADWLYLQVRDTQPHWWLTA